MNNSWETLAAEYRPPGNTQEATEGRTDKEPARIIGNIFHSFADFVGFQFFGQKTNTYLCFQYKTNLESI